MSQTEPTLPPVLPPSRPVLRIVLEAVVIGILGFILWGLAAELGHWDLGLIVCIVILVVGPPILEMGQIRRARARQGSSSLPPVERR